MNLIFKYSIMALCLFSGLTFSSKIKIKDTSGSIYASPSVMCSTIGGFLDINPECATKPLAARLDIKWQTGMKITANEDGQYFFNQGLFHLYGFNHAEAERSFKEGIRLDPDCAMCYWGSSLALGPNINVPMPPEQYQSAYENSQLALGISKSISYKEKALIGALQSRYTKDPPEDRSILDKQYAEEMKIVSNRFREDLDIATLYAESLMDLMPWDYWETDGSPKPETREIKSILDYVFEKDINHPGANHYYIHLTEAVHPSQGVASADRLMKQAYPSGHLIHMPSHIYIRVGRFSDASLANEKAIIADEDYIAKSNAQGVYPALYYPHNIHFLWFAKLMEGKKKDAINAAHKINEKVNYAMTVKVPLVERFMPIEVLTKVRFRLWDEVLAMTEPDDRYKYAQNMFHYARGMAHANKGKLAIAKKNLQDLKHGLEDEHLRSIDNPQFPTIGISKIAIHVLTATIAEKEGEIEKQITHFEKAVEDQDNLIYMEPPFFYYSVRHSLAASYYSAGMFDKALSVFQEDLDNFPANGWALKGKYESLLKLGETKQAKEVQLAFDDAWQESDYDLKMEYLN